MIAKHSYPKHSFSYIRHASQAQKIEMQEICDDENKFQQQEPHGEWDENGKEQPIVFRLERHECWQMQAYTPDGKMMDNSYHELFCICNDCGHMFLYNSGGDDSGDWQWCYECNTDLSGGYVKR